jgi:hypothetical protein
MTRRAPKGSGSGNARARAAKAKAKAKRREAKRMRMLAAGGDSPYAAKRKWLNREAARLGVRQVFGFDYPDKPWRG